MSRDPRAEILRRAKACRWLWPIACLLASAQAVGAAEAGGLVVESVTPNSAASLAGLEAGDLLLRWRYQPDKLEEGLPRAGDLDTPFDLTEPFVEMLPRGPLTFDGWRQGRAHSWTFHTTGALSPGLTARPVMDSDRWERFQKALREISSAVPGSDPPPAIPSGEALPTGSPRLAAWYLLHWAEAAASAGHLESADHAAGLASEILLRASDPSARAALLRAWAYLHLHRRELARARELFEAALALDRQREGAELSVAYTLGILADVFDREGDLATAERLWLERLEILEKLVPESLEVARSLDYLGYYALWRGDTATAQVRLLRSEAIQRPVAAVSLEYAGTLTKLSLLAQDLGDLERAEVLQRQVLALNEQLSPRSQNHAGSLMNLSTTLILRGELAAAEDLLRQSVELFDTPDADPWTAAGPHVNLGMLAMYRGDLPAAQAYFEFALGRLRKGPASIELAGAYSNLAEVARRQKRFADARTLETTALSIHEHSEPGPLARAARLQALARIERESGELAEAEALLRQAEAAALEAAPESPQADEIRRDLGRVLAENGRSAEAEALFRKILSNLERRGLVGTTGEAEIRNLLGNVERRRGDLAAAEESLCAATRILDHQRLRLGGSLESRSWFELDAQSYSFDCLSVLLERGRSAEAFHALERGKSRAFLEHLGERDLRLMETPAELKAERERWDAEYDRLLARLSQPGAAEETAALRAGIEDIKAARGALVARLRLQSPRLAALQVPAPLDLAEARRGLDPGTVLLAYAVGPEQSYLFVVSPGEVRGPGLEVHRLPIGRDALVKEIEAHRRLLTDPHSDRETLNARASRLYDLLLRPAEASLLRARRLLVSADGPLHLLPWAALRRRNRYLAEQWPIHLTASMTVYAETRQRRRPATDPGTWRLVAFGDPRYPQVTSTDGETLGDSEVRSALRRGVRLEPLPGTRAEIRELAELFAGAQVYLGEEATEERAKQASPQADLLHFASHGLIDERFPLDSALALTIPVQLQEGRDNGLLQAWEIFETVRLDAHLVTLSACDTALGKEMGGEGILGLTRAFQFAGARSVLASLWPVSDASTATLMKRFYAFLRQGKPKDEALRAAQLDLLGAKASALSHPFHWAGFSLYGDWR